MRILYIHQYFKTPSDGGSLRSYYLAKELVKAGHQVVMLTAHNHPEKTQRNIEGIEVIYFPVGYSNQMDFSTRGKAFLKFMVLACMESLRQRKIDLCYVMTTPLSTGVIALFNKFIMSRPYIFEVGDLWPKVPIDMGLLKGRRKQKFLLWMEKVFYRNAKGLVGLSPPITQHLQSIAPKVASQTVYNISACSEIEISKKQPSLEQKYGVENQFVISYAGTFGLANRLEGWIAFAKEVESLPIKFLMVGDGAEKPKFCELIAQIGLKNIEVFEYMDKVQLQEVVNITDAMLVSFAPYDSLHTGSPNKFFDALAAGKLVITNFGGWVGEIITEKQCGFYAEDRASFKLQLSDFLDDKEKLKTFQNNARCLAEKRFDLSIQSHNQQTFIQKLFS